MTISVDTKYKPKDKSLMKFLTDGKLVGELQLKGGKIAFSGDTAESAKIFFELLIDLATSWNVYEQLQTG